MSNGDKHQWISFDAVDADTGENKTLMVDATFLRSAWTCIYGQGCKGVLDHDATALGEGCCSHGAHFIDEADIQTVIDSSARLTKQQWQNYKKGHNKGILGDQDGTTTTRVVNGVCIFHNQPDFPGGAGCALHIAAMEAGERPMDWKPDVCWQLPLRLEHHRDTNGHLVSTLREWKRRDWGEGGDDFHWWCTESADAFVGTIPTYEYLSGEITELVGESAYRQIVELLRATESVPLPHPAVRRNR